MGKTILMVAAEPREFEGLRNHCVLRPLDWGLQFACEADLNGDKAILVAHGAGMQLAGEAADIARRHLRPDVVVSTGFCGAIDPDLAAGDVFVASTVIDQENKREYGVSSPGRKPDGALVSVNRVANTSEQKRALRSTGARVIEMEAAAVAARAAIWEVPFYCIRSVSDTAGQSFEIDFNRMRDGSGRFSRGRIALAAIGRPWSRIPALLKLNRACRAASKSLGDFLADCRF